MDDHTLKQIHAEMIECTGRALGLVVTAFARRMDAERLTQDLRSTIDQARALNEPALALRLATHALAAAEADSAHQARTKH